MLFRSVFAPKIIGSKLATDTMVHEQGSCKVDWCSARVEASLKGFVDLVVIRILVVVGK